MKASARLHPFFNFTRQENWVIQSASADHPIIDNYAERVDQLSEQDMELIINTFYPIHDLKAKEQKEGIKKIIDKNGKHFKGNIYLNRALNSIDSSLLVQNTTLKNLLSPTKNLAIIIPGQLRKVQRAKDLIANMSRHADVFICTDSEYVEEVKQLNPKCHEIIDGTEDFANKKYPTAINQWIKLDRCLDLVATEEERRGRPYKAILKLRTDYYYNNPTNLLREIKQNTSNTGINFFGSSDKVFYAQRDLFAILKKFWSISLGLFTSESSFEQDINYDQILQSDDCIKWYGIKIPIDKSQINASVKEMRESIRTHEVFKNNDGQEVYFWQRFTGNSYYASEVAFARYLNLLGIPMKFSPSLEGFLYSDR